MNPTEAERYSMCYDCWWERDPRNIKNGGTVDLEKKMGGITSLNNRFIVEPYKGDRTLKSNATSGFAIVQQKVSLVGLTLLADVDILGNGTALHFYKGSKVYIKEELLFTQPWAKNVFESDAIEGKFIIVDSGYVEFIKQVIP
jgi:hypothetical protein